MNSTILAYLATALTYVALAVYFWKTRWSPASNEQHTIAANSAWERAAVVLPLILHAGLLYSAVLAGSSVTLGVGIAVSIIVWLCVFIYWLGSFVHRVEGLQALVMPIAALACLLPLIAPSTRALPNTELLAFKAHLIISMLAYSLFTIASLHALLMALLEKRLHGGHLGTGRSALPPLLTMESINHKAVFGVLSWLIFGALLAGRARYGWRGRTVMRWTLAGFLMLVLAYLGSRFVVEFILQRGA